MQCDAADRKSFAYDYGWQPVFFDLLNGLRTAAVVSDGSPYERPPVEGHQMYHNHPGLQIFCVLPDVRYRLRYFCAELPGPVDYGTVCFVPGHFGKCSDILLFRSIGNHFSLSVSDSFFIIRIILSGICVI